MSKKQTTKPDGTRQLTVLTTRGVNAVKTFKLVDGEVRVTGYGKAKRFTHEVIEVDDRGAWLKALRKRRDSFVVLGAPKDWKRGEVKRRLSSPRDGEEATLEPVPRRWMPIDVDQIDFDPMASIDDGETFAGEVLDFLRLKGVRCVWHLTNSHGFFGKYRARLWIELDRPLDCAAMKALAESRWGDLKVEGKRCVDLSVYQPQQPIYTGDPILEGLDDPAARRVGFIDGEALRLEGVTPKAKRKEGAPKDGNVAKLIEAGLYIERLRPGQHMVECPWEDEHTGPARRDDTFYFEPHYNGHDIPAFKCHHDSCDKRRWDDVLKVLGVSSFDPVDGEGEVVPNWVYVHRRKMFWDGRDGSLIERDSFDTTHGGRSKRGTPTERFLANENCQKADEVEFLPGQPLFAKRGRLRILNAYVDQRLEPDASIDVTPWTDHLAWCVPDERDRELLMDWIAWCYQNPGDKIAWSPILFSRAFGVGKTTIFNALAECLGRAHVSEPTQAELEDKFNDWCFGKLLVKIEELMSGNKFHVAEKLKPVVANPTLSIRRMHQTGFSVSNFANVCASTNHMNALPVERGDRRWMLIQCVEADKVVRRPKMKEFHEWLKDVGHGGIANWLKRRDVSDFQPKGEAPMTKLRGIVAESSMTDVDRAHELCEAFDKFDLVSSDMVEDYLRANLGSAVVDRIVNQLGSIAYRRGWKKPSKVVTGGRNKMRVAKTRPSFWIPRGDGGAYLKLLKAKGEARTHDYQELLAKVSFDGA